MRDHNPASFGRLSPERLDLRKLRIGPPRLVHQRSEARFLAPGQPAGGECLSGADTLELVTRVVTLDELFRQLLVHADIVEIAERILQPLEGSGKIAPTLRLLLARKGAGEEFRRIAQLLDVNAQPVA